MKAFRNLISIIFVMAILNAAVYAVDLTEKIRMGVFDSNMPFLSGFRFGTVADSTQQHSLREWVAAEAEAINSSIHGPYFVVGHSQGGMRALAHISEIRRRAESDDSYDPSRLRAVITVSGIDKGFLPLKDGLDPLKRTLYTKVDIIWNGFVGGLAIFPMLDILIENIHSRTDSMDSFYKDDSAWNLAVDLAAMLLVSTGSFDQTVGNALVSGNLDALPEVKDMATGSAFMQEYVSEFEERQVKGISGYYPTIKLEKRKIWFATVWVPVVVMAPRYTYYEVETYTPRFSDVPVGYIVGTKSDTIGMLPNDMQEIIDNTVAVCNVAGGAAIAAHVGKCALGVGLFTGSPRHITNISKMLMLLNNKQEAINDLLGSDENDGFIAKKSQYYTRSEYSNNLVKNSLGYVSLHYNHSEINPDGDSESADRVKREVYKLINNLDE